MIFSLVSLRRPARRARAPEKDRSIALVVGLMMALVFAPVLGLHLAASVLAAPVAAVTATGPAPIDLATERRMDRPAPG